MKGTKLLLSFWLTTAAFCLLQIVFGPGGFTETARLQEHNRLLETRLETLVAENARLTARYQALKSSAEAVRLEARSLGWFLPGEVPVRTLGGAQFHLPPDEPDLSMVPALPNTDEQTTVFFRLAWPLLFCVFYAFLHLAGRLWPSRQDWGLTIRPTGRTLPVPLQAGLDFFRK